MTYLTADEAAKHFRFPTTKAFYAFCSKRRGSLPVTYRGRVMLIDPVAFTEALNAPQGAV